MDMLVNIDVDDLEKAVAFYGTAFDLRIGRRLGNDCVEMIGSSVPIYLLAKEADSAATKAAAQVRNYERHWTPTHLDFVVDDIESAVNKAILAGANVEQPIAAHVWGKLAGLADPFGHGFCFVQFVGRGYDEIAE